MLIFHNLFKEAFNPDAVDFIYIKQIDTRSKLETCLEMCLGESHLLSDPIDNGMSKALQMLNDLVVLVNSACEAQDEMPEPEYDGETPLPNMLELEISNNTGTLLTLLLNPREGLEWDSGAMIMDRPFKISIKPETFPKDLN